MRAAVAERAARGFAPAAEEGGAGGGEEEGKERGRERCFDRCFDRFPNIPGENNVCARYHTSSLSHARNIKL